MICALIALTLSTLALAAPATVEKREITQELLDTLTRFTNFSSGAYQASCPSPLGTNLVLQVSAYELDSSKVVLKTCIVQR